MIFFTISLILLYCMNDTGPKWETAEFVIPYNQSINHQGFLWSSMRNSDIKLVKKWAWSPCRIQWIRHTLHYIDVNYYWFYLWWNICYGQVTPSQTCQVFTIHTQVWPSDQLALILCLTFTHTKVKGQHWPWPLTPDRLTL